jgi:hypothetical protein
MKNLLSIPKVKELKVKFLKVNDKTNEFTVENVFNDSTVRDLKHKIFCETDVKPSSQYLFIETPLDDYFFESLENIFKNRSILSNKHIVSQISKILSDKDSKKIDSNLKKTKLNIDEVADFIRKNVSTYLKPVNIIFRNSIEHINLINFNQITDSFSENLDNKSLSSYNILNNTIYLYSKKDLIENYKGSNKDSLLEKYFQGSDIGIQKKKVCDSIEKLDAELIKIYQKDEKIADSFKKEYGSSFGDIVNNKIASLSILINNFFHQDCDIQRLFNLLELDEKVIFSKFSVKRKKQFYKIFKPSFLGKTASVTRNQFSSFKNFKISENEKEYFNTKSVVYFKILYEQDFITFHLNSNNQILIKVESEDIELNKLKEIIFDFIARLKAIDDEPFENLNEKEFLDSSIYKIIEVSMNKKLLIEKNISTNTLRKILENENRYIFSLDYPDSKRISYGYKRTNNFRIDKNINYLLEKIFIKQNEKDVAKAKKYLEDVFDMESIDEKFTRFMENYADETKSKYDLEMPHFNIISKDGHYTIKMANFSDINELNIVNQIIDRVFEKFMLEKESKGKRNNIKGEQSNEESNNEGSRLESSNDSDGSLSASNNNSSGNSAGKVVGLNSNNENSNSKSLSNNYEEIEGNSIELLDTPFEFEKKNYTSYMKTMRNYFNKELFENKDYTKKCRRQPYIVSKRHFNRNINRKNKYNTLRGLDTKIIDNDGNAKDIDNYYLESSNKKDIYICPRIWCAQDNLPIDPIYFAKYKKCPVCGGGAIGRTGKMTKDKCVIVVKAEVDYFKSDGTKKKNYLKHIFGDKPIPEELKDLEMGMYPKPLDIKKDPSNKGLACCQKSVGSEKIEEKKSKESVKDLASEPYTFVFLTDSKFPVKKDNKIAFLPNQLDTLLDNKETKKISEIKRNGHQYIFKFRGKNITMGFKNALKKVEKIKDGIEEKDGEEENYAENLFRLTVGDEKNRSFLNAIEKLYNVSSTTPKSIDSLIEDKTKFTPLLFCSLNNGNLVELFKGDIDDMEDYQKWLDEYQDELERKNIKGESLLKNIYTSYTNFKHYHFSDGVKDYNIYQDLLGRKDFLFDENLNILIIEIDASENNHDINLLCPQNILGQQYFKTENNTIILITQKKKPSKKESNKKDSNDIYIFEPIICLRFLDIKTKVENKKPYNPIYKFNYFKQTDTASYRQVITSLINLMKGKCNEVKDTISNEIFENNLEDLSTIMEKLKTHKVKKYILGYGVKIQGILLEKNIYIPILPSGINKNILSNLQNINYLNKNLINKKSYETNLKELIKTDKIFKSYKIKNLITQENDSNKIVKGAILNNGTIIPLKEESIDKKIKTLDYKDYYELSLDEEIYDRKEIDNKRIKFNYDYNNENYQFQKIRFLFNNFIRSSKNEKLRETLKKIIINPVIPLSMKRENVKDIVENSFEELFHFGKMADKPELFKNKTKKVSKCHNLTKKKCNEECIYKKDKCYTFITNKNMITDEDNKEKYTRQIIEEIVRDKNKGIDFITKKIDNITEIDFTNKKNEMIFGDDLFDSLEKKLRKRGNKFMRDIKIFNTIEQKNNVVISDDIWSKIKEGGKTIKDKLEKTKRSKAPSKVPSINRIYGSNVNLFGNKVKHAKIKKGECIFPFKILKRGEEDETTKVLNDCVPQIPIEKKKDGKDYIINADGVFCPTKVEGIHEKHRNPDGTHKFWEKKTKKDEAHYTYYENNNETPKGFCDMEEFIKRQRDEGTLKNKRINPKCKKTYKRKGYSNFIPTNVSNNDGDRYTCIVENNPDKIKNKFEAQLICPIELDDDTYDYKKHKTEDCFV